jgi:tetratricopeptide (TPR) repeat protein
MSSVKNQMQEHMRIFKLLKQIDVLMDNEKYRDIIPICDKILKIDEKNFDAVTYKAIAFLSLNDFKKALAHFRKANRIEANHYEILQAIACILFSFHQFDEAREVLRKAAQIEGGEYSSFQYFKFRNCNIVLEIVDPSTMLAHHAWIWDLVNISPKLLDSMLYSISGDVPRDLIDLKIQSVSNSYGELSIVPKLDLPDHKEFYAVLPVIIPPYENNTITLRFEWEEPYRYYIYFIPTICDNFQYTLYFPDGFDFNVKFSLIDTETGETKLQNQPYKIEKLDNKTKVFWEFKNPDPKFNFRVDW